MLLSQELLTSCCGNSYSFYLSAASAWTSHLGSHGRPLRNFKHNQPLCNKHESQRTLSLPSDSTSFSFSLSRPSYTFRLFDSVLEWRRGENKSGVTKNTMRPSPLTIWTTCATAVHVRRTYAHNHPHWNAVFAVFARVQARSSYGGLPLSSKAILPLPSKAILPSPAILRKGKEVRYMCCVGAIRQLCGLAWTGWRYCW